MIAQISGVVFLALGFGFVIFWHELGHFLAAKSVGIRCEQFAVGFGQAIFSWRKGMGFTAGSSKQAYDTRIAEERTKREATIARNTEGELTRPLAETDDHLASALGLGETEYRLNWIPLGGYVKMLGQDDLDPNAKSVDPRAFNNKSVPARMVVVSAGVLMNILLAMIGFAIVFGFGFDAPPAVVGSFMQGSPAQKAGLHVGDRIAYLNDSYQHDFTKLAPNVALAGDDANLRLVVQRPDGSFYTTMISPSRESDGGGKGFLVLGVGQPADLIGPADSPDVRDLLKQSDLIDPQARLLQPGEIITAVNGTPLANIPTAQQLHDDPAIRDRAFLDKRANLAALDDAVQNSHGELVKLTVIDPAGATHERLVQPQIAPPFDGKSVRFAGMSMRSSIQLVDDASPAKDKLLPGDVVLSITDNSLPPITVSSPSIEQLKLALNTAGEAGQHVKLVVQRGDQTITLSDIATIKLPNKRHGLNVGLAMDDQQAVVGDVAAGSAADKAGIKPGMTIASINGAAVKTWFQIKDALGACTPDQPIAVTVDGQPKPLTIAGLSLDELSSIRSIRYEHELQIQVMSMPRQTSNPLQAAVWGVNETRDLLVQFYVSLRRMIDGSVPASGMMGPVGIFHAGTGFAAKGNVWLIWFLCMISANLAVVNFLPIPIVDGGLFTFLIIEWIQGRPLSQRAQSIAQMVGLALIGFVFVFATWQDIARMF